MNGSQLTQSDSTVRSGFKNHTYGKSGVKIGVQISKGKFIHIYI